MPLSMVLIALIQKATHDQFNSRMDQLLLSEKATSRAEGVASERDRPHA